MPNNQSQAIATYLKESSEWFMNHISLIDFDLLILRYEEIASKISPLIIGDVDETDAKNKIMARQQIQNSICYLNWMREEWEQEEQDEFKYNELSHFSLQVQVEYGNRMQVIFEKMLYIDLDAIEQLMEDEHAKLKSCYWVVSDFVSRIKAIRKRHTSPDEN